jgi:PAS domain S-box-containing protein
VAAPIFVEGRVWGMIFASTMAVEIAEGTESRVVDFAELVATAIANTEARRELERVATEQAALRRVATLVAAGIEPEELFSVVSDEVAHLFAADGAGIGRFEHDGSEVITVGRSESLRSIPVGSRQDLDKTLISGDVYRTGRAARKDLREDEAVGATALGEQARQILAMGFISTVAAPIVVEGELWGLVTASSTQTILPADTENRLESFSELVATAIANAESRTKLSASEGRARELANEQAALRRVATLVAAGIEPDELFSAVSDEVAGLFSVDGAGVGRYEPDGSEVVTVGTSKSLRSIVIGSRVELDKSIIGGEVYRTGRAARNDMSPGDVGDAGSLGDLSQRVLAMGFSSTVGAPIVVEGELWGVVTASSSHTTLPADTEKRVESFCELLATAIANAQGRTELAASEARARALATEQAALRRVATLVAQGASPDELFSAVAHEVAGIIDIPVVAVNRYEADGTFTILGIAGDTTFTLGSRWPVEEEGIAGMILATGRPSRVDDYSTMTGQLGEAVREDLVVSTLGVPIVVEGSIWGFMIAAAKPGKPIPADTEARLVRFTELVATAVSNTTTRSELIASRARIVAAGDEAKRRIERNLHDGTQQRLIALGLDLQTVRDSVPEDQQDAHSGLRRIRHELEAVLEDVRELSHGLHPALLSQAGLGPSLRALARKSPIPVKLDVSVSQRPSESTETAVYYVISEALANAAKHSRASEISVVLTTSRSEIRAIIEDDGGGGAEASAGSGLVGLIDRVEALGGRFALDSPAGRGTRISIEMPLIAEPLDGLERVPRGRRSTPGDGPSSSAELSEAMDEALHAAIAASADALYIVDPQGRIRFLNPAALRTLGYEDERQLLGRPSHDTIHYLRRDGSPYPAAECPLLRPRLNGETVRVEEDWFVKQDGSLVAVSYSSAPVALPDGRGAVVSFREAHPG